MYKNRLSISIRGCWLVLFLTALGMPAVQADTGGDTESSQATETSQADIVAAGLANDVEGRAERDPYEFPVQLTLAAGLQYDDNVTVDELDETSNVSDTAALFDFDADYKKRFNQGTDLSVGYSLAQRTFFEESEFDLQIHNGKLGLKQNFDGFDVGADFYTIHARLDRDGLLNIQQLAPYFTTFLTEKLYLRSSYRYQDKSFKENKDRNAHTHAIDNDLYYFLDSTREYFVAGYRFESEDTRADQFDYNAHQFVVRYARRWNLYGNRPLRMRLDWRFEMRNYESITPSIGEIRDDDRHRLRARFDVPISKTLTALLKYEYRNHASNLETVDFTDNRVEAQLQMVLF
ncbi:MAG: DUF560 domain-containing protein [Gammaproteobacteria bacterium]|nr:DUF560 domain-containing protein [Gammaproteobacteria bacterium]